VIDRYHQREKKTDKPHDGNFCIADCQALASYSRKVERCPPIIAMFPLELQKLITFWAESLAANFDRAISGTDLVLVDGNADSF